MTIKLVIKNIAAHKNTVWQKNYSKCFDTIMNNNEWINTFYSSCGHQNLVAFLQPES